MLPQFAGKERDGETGNDNFTARYFGSGMGRFMSADSSGISLGDLSDPQQLNLYSYVRNNPLSLTDPTGLKCNAPPQGSNSQDALDNSGAGFDFSLFDSSQSDCEESGGQWVDSLPSTTVVVTAPYPDEEPLQDDLTAVQHHASNSRATRS